MIQLTDQQQEAVFHALRPLPKEAREAFLQALASALAGQPGPVGDGELWRLIARIQKQVWTPPKEKPPDQWRRRVGPAIP